MPIEKLTLADIYRKHVLTDQLLGLYQREIEEHTREAKELQDGYGRVAHGLRWRDPRLPKYLERAAHAVRWLTNNGSPQRELASWEQGLLKIEVSEDLQEVRGVRHCLQRLWSCRQLVLERGLLQDLGSGKLIAKGVREPVAHDPVIFEIDPLIWSRPELTFDFDCSMIFAGDNSELRMGYHLGDPGVQMRFSNITVATARERKKSGPKSMAMRIRDSFQKLERSGKFRHCQTITDHCPPIRTEVNDQLGREPDERRGLSNETIRRHITHLIPESRKRSTKQSTKQ